MTAAVSTAQSTNAISVTNQESPEQKSNVEGTLTLEQQRAIFERMEKMVADDAKWKEALIKEITGLRTDIRQLKDENSRLKTLALITSAVAITCVGYVFGPIFAANFLGVSAAASTL